MKSSMTKRGILTFEFVISIAVVLTIVSIIIVSLENLKENIDLELKTVKEIVITQQDLLMINQKIIERGYSSSEIGNYTLNSGKLTKPVEVKIIEVEIFVKEEKTSEESI